MDKTTNQLGLNRALEKLRGNFQEGLKLIKGLEEETRLELHLGEMDVKQAWAKLEADLSKAEHQALQEAPAVVDRAVEALRSVRDRLDGAPAKSTAKPARR
jgi:hypothetical protein